MSWLTIRFAPGFQEDLTSWVMYISDSGEIKQEVDICRFSPSEKRKETHHSILSAAQVTELKALLASLDFDQIKREESRYVIDDAEQIQVTYEGNARPEEFISPLQHWLWRQSRGEAIPESIKGAAALWQYVRALSQYNARYAKNA